MTDISRRGMLQAAGLLTMGAVTGCASSRSGGKDQAIFSIEQPSIPIVGSNDRFPVRRIYCIGRNYAAHAREMGSDPTREPPFFFQKPSDSIQFVPPGKTVDHPYPTLTKNYHYEIELVAAINKGGKNIPVETALQHVFGYAVGLDMTRRDLQAAMKKEEKPWEIGKSFDMSAPIGPLHPVASIGNFTQGKIWLKVNGQVKQSSDLKNMIWSVAEQISNLSKAFELFPGDIIYSGTPENVGPVVRGDVMEGYIEKLPSITLKVV
ncbi:fumarylacetoacetate hydrolase family protein [Herminiimonas fonticola]|uniref:2-keto-4-pentenoate hydratase/2-oxohepta-3-ene-1,7-dioic acid hydratase in catechol pathway n=1 Tax=Herminiimonas fonticola TaxID=303380 RepID=A0A4R6G8B5_9BURK|nr:fumarylacetoacetate hydrolase family protein [Herminiimonas fonticola]RBA24055.1 2-keto-4-pentenoate hydratase/2-oxohepta-3-ene-17-dioic acid hydratase (catechol pathway) [Herminiimonas fonticola]TDN90054.1 2-keto-4-pentenoate hydratase/2-oxohepta-3-ene-1,7-dioic acid hydratase in catechol pathway [Herminiimonas fonticola]